jgi:putative addiction module component (TIGR02574 family)
MTVEQIIKEARDWPAERVEELVTRLHQVLDGHVEDPAVDQAWKIEVRRRLAEIDNGSVQPIDGEKVSAEVRKLVGR